MVDLTLHYLEQVVFIVLIYLGGFAYYLKPVLLTHFHAWIVDVLIIFFNFLRFMLSFLCTKEIEPF